MKNIQLTIFFLLFNCSLFAQKGQTITINGHVRDSKTKESLIGAALVAKGDMVHTITDTEGSYSFKLSDVGSDSIELAISYVGYTTLIKKIAAHQDATIDFDLETVEDLEAVTVTSTRTNSRIEDIATKVEVLGEEEMLEESGIKPANVASILGDLSVIHIQQTSAVSGAASIRMQGLDSKYTQLLRDGLPLYEGFSGSFGVLQIPPLDLKQVEIVKGSNSTLYGGGAIGGMINLISKEPTEKTEATLLLNQSTLKESNVNGYFAKRFGKIGLTNFVGTTFQKAVDVNKDGFSDAPFVKTLVFHPRLFVYFNPKTTLKMGYNSTLEDRNGGDLIAINTSPTATHPFFEKNKSNRQSIDGQFITEQNNHHITFKGVYSHFDRTVNQSGYIFQGGQKSIYTEGSDFLKLGKHDLVFGANYIQDAFEKKATDTSKITNFNNQTVGVFLQDGWQIAEKWFVEMGLRSDFLNRTVAQNKAQNTAFLLPRLALLYKPNKDFTARLAIGSGYKVPTVFTAQALAGSFREIPPLSINVVSERSTSVNGDLNYHVLIGEMGLWLNQAFYYTTIQKPVVLAENSLKNADYVVRSLGSDTYIRLSLDEIELYVGYNHTLSDASKKPVLLAPRDKFALTAAYEVEGKWRMGIEAAWVGNQYLTDTQTAPNYWFWAGMIERKFGEHISLVLNCENLFDARQSRKEALFMGTVQNPIFKSVYMPIDGRVVNLSLRLKI